MLPADVLRKILELVGVEWRDRRVQAAKEEVREWTQYCLVSREWRAAFQDLPLCIEFDEVRALNLSDQARLISLVLWSRTSKTSEWTLRCQVELWHFEAKAKQALPLCTPAPLLRRTDVHHRGVGINRFDGDES